MGEMSIFIFGVLKPNFIKDFFSVMMHLLGDLLSLTFRRKVLSRAQRKKLFNYVGSTTCNGQPQ